MKYVYFDDSIHDRGGFIIGAFVSLTKDPDTDLSNILINNGFDPNNDEFKSSTHFKECPKMIDVRDQLKSYVRNNCGISIIVLPRKNRDKLGAETINAFHKMVQFNTINDPMSIYFDEGIFKNIKDGQKIASQYSFDRCNFNFKTSSVTCKGIQLADLVAHTCSVMLLDQMGLINKTIKAGDNSGYAPDTDIELGFELWASIRGNFFCKQKAVSSPYYIVEPYGLYISHLCSNSLSIKARERFGETYRGCIH